MKYVAIGTIVLFGSLLGAKGAIFNINNIDQGAGDYLHADESGNLLSGENTIVTLGYFPASFDVIGNLNNIPFLLQNYTIAAFSPVGLNSPSLSGGPYPGFVEVEGPLVLGNYIPQPPDMVLGPFAPLYLRPLFSFAGNASTLGAATSFSLNTAGTLGFDTSPTIQRSYSSNPRDRIILIGNVTQITGNFGGPDFGPNTTFNRLQLIPEPSVILLSAFGVFGLLRRRR